MRKPQVSSAEITSEHLKMCLVSLRRAPLYSKTLEPLPFRLGLLLFLHAFQLAYLHTLLSGLVTGLEHAKHSLQYGTAPSVFMSLVSSAPVTLLGLIQSSRCGPAISEYLPQEDRPASCLWGPSSGKQMMLGCLMTEKPDLLTHHPPPRHTGAPARGVAPK